MHLPFSRERSSSLAPSLAPSLSTAILCVLFTTGLRGDEIDYSRDIQPILSANCFHCHGADQAKREASLRLDQRAEAIAAREDGAAIVPGKPAESVLVKRIASHDEGEVMPPKDSGKVLTREQIELITKWIEGGAEYSSHWAFVPPLRPEVPGAAHADWVKNPIDAFISERLHEEGLRPSPAADDRTWIRRLHFDLVGLPPEPSEVHTYLNDIQQAGSDAQARAAVKSNWTNRLLQSPHFGEKWGRHWLDAARYADSDGFEKDKPRDVWFYRDYVINALNADKPYNQFLLEQLAGDLLPNATQDQIVATGFLRNSMVNEEGGVDPEQFRMEAMFDRMDAVGKAMLGLTIQCCQCHNHKYDPLSQDDYYRIFAFLNNSHEGSITVYTREEQQQREQILRDVEAIEKELQQGDPGWQEKLNAWAESLHTPTPEWTTIRPQLDTSGGQKHYLLEDGSILAQGYAPTKHTTEFTGETTQGKLTSLRVELLNDPNLPHGGPGRAPDGLCALSEFKATITPLGGDGKPIEAKFSSVTANVNPPEQELHARYDDKSMKRRVTGPAAYALDNNNDTAWGIDIGGGRSNVPREAVFTLEQPLENAAGFRVTFKLVQMHGGWNSDDNQNNNLGRFRLSVAGAEGASADTIPARIRRLADLNASERTPQQQAELFSHWRTTVSDWQPANDKIEALWQKHPRGTSQLVAQERNAPRTTHRLNRGDFLKPAEAVTPGVPDWMQDLQATEGREPNRLDFAKWMSDRNSPTVARSIVNRVWQAYFGIGLVETSEDLGTQGAYPSHPELLDWLAVELMEHDWSLKHIHRLICESATYEQASVVSPQLFARDPYNRLLARGPRVRLEGELVRDAALAASGLLNPQVGGPSVYPPAPEFLFSPPASYGPKTWGHDTGPSKYRRGLYTFRFRSIPYPVLQNFDAPNGDFACIRRTRSNTPLQALTTLNEPLFVECAQALALKAIREGGASDDERLGFAFERCLSRTPDETEQATLLNFLSQQRERLAEGDGQPKILPATGMTLPSGTTPNEAAAWTALARVLLNLDETISKE